MSEDLLDAVTAEPEAEAAGAVIWLHGLGASGRDFEPVLPLLPLSRMGVRVVLPHAPPKPVTLNMGMIMPAWYDIRSLEDRRDEDAAGIRASAARIEALIAVEKAKGIPASRIALVGFSQGGAMALYAGLRHAETLAGIASLSAYLVLAESLEAERASANARTPVFLAHGTLDPVVPVGGGALSRDRLKDLGQPVEWREYPMEHQVCEQELGDLAAWFKKIFQAPAV